MNSNDRADDPAPGAEQPSLESRAQWELCPPVCGTRRLSAVSCLGYRCGRPACDPSCASLTTELTGGISVLCVEGDVTGQLLKFSKGGGA
ncbi:unnamed protein product [Arctogadus glacialis]